MHPARTYPRWPTERTIALRTASGTFEALMAQISKCGLFVRMAAPPPPGVSIEIDVETELGRLVLPARVVRTEGGMNGAIGIAIERTQLDQQARERLDRFVDAVAAAYLENELSSAKSNPIAELKLFMDHVDRNDLYSALRMTPSATAQQLEHRAGVMREQFETARKTATIPQKMRFERAATLLERVMNTLGNTQARLEYDFQEDHVHPEKRTSAAIAGTGLSIRTLRDTWARLFPDRIAASRSFFANALEAKRTHTALEGLRSLQAAIELDPFNMELRQTWATWRQEVPNRAA